LMDHSLIDLIPGHSL